MAQKKTGMTLFLTLSFVLGWGTISLFYLWDIPFGSTNGGLVLDILSFLPAVVMGICRMLEGSPFSWKGIGLHPQMGDNGKRYLFAYFFPVLVAAVGSFFFFVLRPAQYDPNMVSFTGILVGNEEINEAQAQSFIYFQLFLAVVLGPVIQILPCVAEELGFRGYLLPKLEKTFQKHSRLMAALVSSALWSAWYLPLYFRGYLYGVGYPGFPVSGMAAGFLFFFALGIVLSYFTQQVGSVLPAALIRSGVISIAAVPMYFTAGDTVSILGPFLYGFTGCGAMIVAAVVCGVLMIRKENGKEEHRLPMGRRL